ncbi:hypothetical protein SADUNF_Sadunf02G0137100 [Salix dunnii]|uniref:Uncharacterized protein n=1 Tax=Salix dunnii TaxID=1413687 RepID=A0A835N7U9_9ROSI|nr:hypothetical protein SADUNF_Sadunf02G0137100 [Salix dunnii]
MSVYLATRLLWLFTAMALKTRGIFPLLSPTTLQEIIYFRILLKEKEMEGSKFGEHGVLVSSLWVCQFDNRARHLLNELIGLETILESDTCDALLTGLTTRRF